MTRRHITALAAAVAVVGALAAVADAAAGTSVVTVRTVPVVPGAAIVVGDTLVRTNAKGVARIVVADGEHRVRAPQPRPRHPGERLHFERWGDDSFQPYRLVTVRGDRLLEIGYRVERQVALVFRDPLGASVSPDRVRSVLLANSMGVRETVEPDGRHWLEASRVTRRIGGLEEVPIQYSVVEVDVDGANVVHRFQQRFYPLERAQFSVELLLFSARVTSKDLMFRFPIGDTLLITYPDGKVTRVALENGVVELPLLARATYSLQVEAKGISPIVPVSMTKDQLVELKVVSRLDIAVALSSLAALAIVLLLARRPTLRARLLLRRRRKPVAHLGRLTIVCAGAAVLALGASSPARAEYDGPHISGPIPVFAYYYIWFDERSWRRAKTDYPLLGRYSSDRESVLRRHVSLAQEAGIDGFIVSWKSTETLNRRLATLVRIANELQFKLAVIYQGLDFHREPLPSSRVAADLDYFAKWFAHEPAFNFFAKPLVIWSGTWRFSHEAVARVTAPRRDKLLILASERSPAGFERLADAVDGDAYYWSSVNPATYPGYPDKLAEMSRRVHERGGLWIAPAAPGFDARLIGGTRTVPRHDGETLRAQLSAALSSSPDAVGLISWNEFSENSHVEPSRRHGHRYLSVLRDALSAEIPIRGDFDSSDPPAESIGYAMPLLVGIAAVVLTGIGAAFWRREVRNAAQRSS